MIQSQNLWVITHIWPQEPPTAPKAVSADHRAACMVEATATLHARSDASCGCGSLLLGMDTLRRLAYRSRQKPRVYHALLLMSHTSRRERMSCMAVLASRAGRSEVPYACQGNR